MNRILLTSLTISLLVACGLCAQKPAVAADGEIPESSTDSQPIPNHRFWIVSSRRCPQQLSRLRQCRLDVWSIDCPQHPGAAPIGQEPLRVQRCPQGAAAFRQVLIPGVPVCIAVHGSYVDWERALDYSRETFRWLVRSRPEQSLHFVFYTWPSDPITFVPQADFNELGDRAGINGFYLARVIHHIPVESPVSLIGHSHGAAVAVSAVHLLGGGSLAGYQLPPGTDRGHRIRILLAAAAVDQDWFHPGERYGRAVARSEGLLNLVNRRDWVLGFYQLRSPDSGYAVSRHGFRPVDYERLGGCAARIRQFNVTNIIGKNHTWPNYYSVPSLAQSVLPYVDFSESQGAPLIRILTPPDGGRTQFAAGDETFQRAVSK